VVGQDGPHTIFVLPEESCSYSGLFLVGAWDLYVGGTEVNTQYKKKFTTTCFSLFLSC
jgi:hypothetical protein